MQSITNESHSKICQFKPNVRTKVFMQLKKKESKHRHDLDDLKEPLGAAAAPVRRGGSSTRTTTMITAFHSRMTYGGC